MRRHVGVASPALLAAVVAAACTGMPFGDAETPDPLPPEKRERLERERQSFADAASSRPKPVDPRAERPARGSDEPWPTGIIEEDESPVPTGYTITNRWVKAVAGGYLVVYAGALSDDPLQGVLVEVRFAAGDAIPTRKVRVAPTAAGALRIVAARGDALTLRSSEGDSFVYDVALGRFQGP